MKNPYALQASFIGSFPSCDICPTFDMPEFAFIGRSNVGKSSLINYLTDNKSLAKTSSTPGKTQTINLFKVNDGWILTDLPGYGFAKVSKKNRDKWDAMNKGYILNRQNLANLFVLIDSRIPPQKIDLEFINWLGEKQVPFSIVFTKTDKQSKLQVSKIVDNYKKILSQDWDELPLMLSTSAISKTGKDELLDLILGACDLYNQAE